MLHTMFIRCFRKDSSRDWQKILDFKTLNAAKEFCEELSKNDDVIRVELSEFQRPNMSYSEYLKRYYPDEV